MIKKILLIISCIIFLSNTSCYMAEAKTDPLLKPLKLENYHNSKYKYGTFEKNFKNPLKNTDENTVNNEQRKVFSALDIINNILFILLIGFIAVLLIAKINKVSMLELFKGKLKVLDNKFKVLSAKELADNHTIYLVEVNAKQLIVGTTKGKVDIVTPLDKSYSYEEIPQEYIENLFNDKSDEFKNLED